MTEELADRLEQALLAMDRLAVGRILSASGRGSDPFSTVERVMMPALERIGRGWESGSYSLSQVYMSGVICEEAVDRILPLSGTPPRGRHPPMAIAVLEDSHLLGKRIVCSVLRAAGFHALDYGTQDVQGLVGRVREDRVEILLISVLMLPSALRVKDLRRALDEAGSPVPIIVGGAPFRLDDRLCREVGADATSATAAGAVETIERILEERACPQRA